MLHLCERAFFGPLVYCYFKGETFMKSVQDNTKTFKKGEVIFRAGDYELFMYDILKGVVGIYADYGITSQQKMTTLYDGDTFGEMGLVDSMPRSATAVALEDTLVAVIDNVTFGEYFQDKPAKIVLVMQHLSSRIRDLTRDYMEACLTIDEYLQAEEKGEPKSESLLSRMKRFVNIARR